MIGESRKVVSVDDVLGPGTVAAQKSRELALDKFNAFHYADDFPLCTRSCHCDTLERLRTSKLVFRIAKETLRTCGNSYLA